METNHSAVTIDIDSDDSQDDAISLDSGSMSEKEDGDDTPNATYKVKDINLRSSDTDTVNERIMPDVNRDHQGTSICPSFYLDDDNIPIYAVDIKKLSNLDMVHLLLEPPEDKIASKNPVKCQENRVFIIDSRSEYFRNSSDWKADDLGVFKNAGTHAVAYYEEQTPELKFLSRSKPDHCTHKTVLLKRTYWKHSVHQDFHRKAFELFRYDGNTFTPSRYLLIQYSFTGKPHAITGRPHGNSKSEKAYSRTKPGVLESIKGKVKTHAHPSKVYDEVFEETGGILNVSSISDVPRNRKQVENAKYQGKPTRSRDELYDVTKQAKEEQECGKVYIRRLTTAPSPACVIGSDRQVHDVSRFCANMTDNFSILSIDTTFNVGNFYVTPTTYRHLLLKNRRTGKSPHLVGPTLVHTRKDEDTFSYFGGTLTGLDKELKNIRYIGSDREEAVESGMSPYFNVATWLACKRHVEEDCRRKLGALGISRDESTSFLQDIFGCDAKKEKGLIDSDSSDDFDAKLQSLEKIWNVREKKVRGKEKSAEFHKYFEMYVAQDMKKKMISPVRNQAGLGEKFFYNNAAESKHSRMKARIKQTYGDRKLSWTEIIDVLKSISEEEERNCERAIVDQGPYKIADPYIQKLEVPFPVYVSKSHAEKGKINKRLHNMPVEFTGGKKGNLSKDSGKKGKNLTECAYQNLPKMVGGKPGESERKRVRQPQKERSTTNYTQRVPTPKRPTLDTNTFKVKWLRGTRVYRCYGCRQNIRPQPVKDVPEVVPPPPWDFVLARLELRQIPNPNGELRMSIKPEPVHYHPKLSCIHKAHGKRFYPQVEVTVADKDCMNNIHFNHLKSEFGIIQ